MIKRRRMTRRKKIILCCAVVPELIFMRTSSAYAPEREYVRLDWQREVSFLAPEEFKRVYRLSLTGFKRLLQLTYNDLRSNSKFVRKSVQPVSPQIHLAMALRFLAGGNVNDIWLRFGVSRSEMYNYVWRTVDAINKRIKVGVDFSDIVALEELESGFAAKSTGQIIRGCVGAIDGIQITFVHLNLHLDKLLKVKIFELVLQSNPKLLQI
jgi:hypothetical protein